MVEFLRTSLPFNKMLIYVLIKYGCLMDEKWVSKLIPQFKSIPVDDNIKEENRGQHYTLALQNPSSR